MWKVFRNKNLKLEKIKIENKKNFVSFVDRYVRSNYYVQMPSQCSNQTQVKGKN